MKLELFNHLTVVRHSSTGLAKHVADGRIHIDEEVHMSAGFENMIEFRLGKAESELDR